MGKRDGRQKGAQTHADGQHGRKAHARFLEQLHEGREEREGQRAAGEGQEDVEGRHRLQERRAQMDEAEFNSERNRARVEIERGNMDADSANARDKTNGMR